MSERAYDLVIFDLDGTLIDSLGDITDALSRTLGRELTDAQVAGWVGAGATELLRRAGATGDIAALVERYRAEYEREPVRHTRPYLRVKETLRALPCDKAIATNKPGGLARTVIERLGLTGDFAMVLGEDDVGQRKPDPLIVDIIRGKLGAIKARTLYVGDSLVDAATAQAAGVDLVLVTYGYEDQERLRAFPARAHLARIEELVPIVVPK